MGSKKVTNHVEENRNEVFSLTLTRVTMRLLSGKWKMQIIGFLFRNGKTRFMGLQRGVDGISARVLSKELQELQLNEIVTRIVIDPKLVTVEYELTEHGKTLESVIDVVTSWSKLHCSHLLSKR